MTLDDFKLMILNDPIVFAIDGMDADIKAKQVDRYLDLVISEASLDYPYDFAMDTADKTTVADQEEYECKGNTNDCRQVYNVRYSTDGVDWELLTKKRPEDMDSYITDYGSPSDVSYWVPTDRSSKFPTIRIVDAPENADETLRYRYWRNNITFDQWPADFLFVLYDGVLSKFNRNLRGDYERSRIRMVSGYEITGGESNPAPPDPLWASRSRSREGHIGY